LTVISFFAACYIALTNCFNTNAAVGSLTSATFAIDEKLMRICYVEGGGDNTKEV
jgi:hypothetical protein